jgi:hypothetical protein
MKKCKNCREEFKPKFSSLEKYCWNPSCKTIEAMQFVDKNRKKEQLEWSKKKAQIKKSLLTASDYMKMVQQVFNAYIRLRDTGRMCISCGRKPLKENAGHFFSQGGHGSVRYDERNVHLQCEHCNTYLSGNLIRYRENLIQKIGMEEFEDLSILAYQTKKWTKEELEELIKEYKEKCKTLKK